MPSTTATIYVQADGRTDITYAGKTAFVMPKYAQLVLRGEVDKLRQLIEHTGYTEESKKNIISIAEAFRDRKIKKLKVTLVTNYDSFRKVEAEVKPDDFSIVQLTPLEFLVRIGSRRFLCKAVERECTELG